MAKIIVITDCDMKGSGYLYLMMPILKGLAELGHEIKVAGLTYDGREHDYPFSIIPAKDVQDTVAIVNNLMYLWSPDLILVGLDIPLQISLYHTLGNFRRPYVAITPLENGPLTMSWAVKLAGMSHVFFISELGKQEALKAGLTHVDHLYVGVDTESWRPSFLEERKQIRSGLGIADDEFVVLSVADNQERKNLSAAMEIIAGLKEQSERKVRFLLVTREFSPFGWNLRDLAVRLGINLEVNIYERGMPRDKLWGLYAVSDAYLCTSKAEGLGMPILDAMAMKIPVVATDTGALTELLDKGRGLLIPPYKLGKKDHFTDVWGNSDRKLIDVEDAIKHFKFILDSYNDDNQDDYDALQSFIRRAYEYVKTRTWDVPTKQVDDVIRRILNEQKPEA